MAKQKVHSLTGRITPQLMQHAYRAVKRNRGAAGVRPLGIPSVRDRVAQEVVRHLLAPIFEPLFHPFSFAYIQGRNAYQALEALLTLHHHGLRNVLDADIAGWFDNLRHQVIMSVVAEEVADGNILRLIEKFPKSGGRHQASFAFVGYADDFVVVCPSALRAEEAWSLARRLRPKSVRKFKDKIRELTPRKHNFEAKVIVKLNRVIGGTARYFARSL